MGVDIRGLSRTRSRPDQSTIVDFTTVWILDKAGQPPRTELSMIQLAAPGQSARVRNGLPVA
jgi:hypothetical protein